MKVWRTLHPVRTPLRRVVATIGVFDGVLKALDALKSSPRAERS